MKTIEPQRARVSSGREKWVAGAIVCFVIAVVTIWGSIKAGIELPWQTRSTIVDLQELPIGDVAICGVVTYVDEERKRFWLQDETGAISLKQDPRLVNVRFGTLVRVHAKKNHAYDPVIGYSSLGLTDVKLTTNSGPVSLPVPVRLPILALLDREKNGVRVSIEGVLHQAAFKSDGRVHLYVGDGKKEVEAILPGRGERFKSWINAGVRLVGVLEVQLDEAGSVESSNIQVQSEADVAKSSEAPAITELSTLRSIYADRKHLRPHRVRLRGRVIQQVAPDLLLVEDPWGAVTCSLDKASAFAAGAPVEVAGFLAEDGLAINLVHSAASRTDELQAPVETPPDPLRTIAEIKHLSDQVAETAPAIRVTGVVTYVDKDWHQFYLQDETAAIFVKYVASPLTVFQGEKITVIGMANRGDFAPVIVAPKFVSRGRALLPKPVPITGAASAMESWFGVVEGIVRPPRGKQNPRHVTFDLFTTMGAIQVAGSPEVKASDIAALVDAKVRIRGVCGEAFNSRRQRIGLLMGLASMHDVEVLKPGVADPFAQTAMPIDTLLQYSPEADFDHRVVVTGSVTMIGNGFFYIQDRTGGMRVEGDPNGLRLHEIVDAAGYAKVTGYSPILTDAVVRPKPQAVSIEPQPVTSELMTDGRFDSQLVSVDAKLLNVERSAGMRTFILRSGARIFRAVVPVTDSDRGFVIPREGSLVRLSGICSVEVNGNSAYTLARKEPVEFKLLIRSPGDIQTLQSGNWWTFGRMLIAMASLLLAITGSILRIVMLGRRLKQQDEELRVATEKANAIRDLILAMQEVRAKKRFTSRVTVPCCKELASLGSEFNHMLEELQLRDAGMAEAERKLQQQALTDALTGLPNRRLLSDRLRQSIESAKRDGNMVAVLYVDLDGFKLVNDSFGHKFGDKLLVEVTARLSCRVRKADTLARLGGDEFAVVLKSVKTIEDAEQVGESLLQSLAAPFEIDNQEITIGASIGIAFFPDHAEDESALLQFADSAMYGAKRAGKNRLMVFRKELGDFARERVALENQLRRAIEDGDIQVHYQPEFEVKTGRLVRFEALARWTHATLGTIPPMKFIPVAEESGLIITLGAQILERACREAVTWQSSSSAPIQVAVNVSTLQFCRESFVDEIRAILKKTGLAPQLLQLELTESVMMKGIDGARITLQRLQEMGVSLAIDDFGTGYSCLSYLPKLAFNCMKVDRAFVKEMLQGSETKAMVRSLVVLAQELGMKVIVEGVETEEQLHIIGEIGGNEVQGYLLGRPTPDPTQYLRTEEKNLLEAGHPISATTA